MLNLLPLCLGGGKIKEKGRDSALTLKPGSWKIKHLNGILAMERKELTRADTGIKIRAIQKHLLPV